MKSVTSYFNSHNVDLNGVELKLQDNLLDTMMDNMWTVYVVMWSICAQLREET